MSQQPRQPVSFYTVTMVALVAGALRWMRLGDWDIWYDEAAMIWHSQRILAMYANNLGLSDLPLFPGMLKAAQLLGASSPLELRVLPFIWGVLTVPLVYALSRRVYRNEMAAQWSMAFAAFSPFLVYYSQELRVYSLFSFMVSLCLLVGMDVGERRYRWLGLGVLWGLTLHTHMVSYIVIAFHGLLLLAVNIRQRQAAKRTLLAGATGIAIAMPFLIPAFIGAETMAYRFTLWHPVPGLVEHLKSAALLLFGYGVTKPMAVYGLALWVIALVGGFLAFRWKGHEAYVFIGVLALPYATLSILAQVLPNSPYLTRYFVYMTPLLLVMAGAGIAWIGGALPEEKPFTRSGTMLGLALGISLLPALANHYRNEMPKYLSFSPGVRPNKPHGDIAAFIEERAKPGTVVLHTCRSSHLPINYYYLPEMDHHAVEADAEYAKHMAQKYPVSIEAVNRVHRNWPLQPLDRMLQGKEEIWVVYSVWDADRFEDIYHQNTKAVAERLNRWGVVVEELNLEDIAVAKYARKAP